MKDKVILTATKQGIQVTGANDVELLNIAKTILAFIANKHGLMFRSSVKGANLSLELIKEEQ